MFLDISNCGNSYSHSQTWVQSIQPPGNQDIVWKAWSTWARWPPKTRKNLGKFVEGLGTGKSIFLSKKGMVAIAIHIAPLRANSPQKGRLMHCHLDHPWQLRQLLLCWIRSQRRGGGWKHCLRGILLFLRHWWWHDLHLRFSKKTCWKTHAPRSESKPLILGMVICGMVINLTVGVYIPIIWIPC